MSPSARLLKDVAAERERLGASWRKKLAYITSHGTDADRRNVTSAISIIANLIRVAQDGGSFWEEDASELFFLNEALRVTKKMAPDDVATFLTGFFGVLHPNHPARSAIGMAFAKPEFRERIIEQIQTGDYSAADGAELADAHLSV